MRVAERVHERIEPPQHRVVHTIVLRLKCIPHQKEAHDAQAKRTQACEILTQLSQVEAIPHIHGAAPWPIVYAEQKSTHTGVLPRHAVRLALAGANAAASRRTP